MSTSATGRLIDEHGLPWPGLIVTVSNDALLWPFELGSQRTGSLGQFTVLYDADPFGRRTLTFRVLDGVKRTLWEETREDIAGATLAIGDLVVRRADAVGFLVTLGTGSPKFRSEENAVTFLIDGDEAFPYLAELLEHAQSSVFLSQLFLSVPEQFKQDPAKEEPALVLRFDPDLSAGALRKVGDRDHPKDLRPERVLLGLAAANPNVDVRLLLNRFEMSGSVLIAVALPVLGLLAIVVGSLVLERGGVGTSVDEVQDYFAAAPAAGIKVEEFRQALLDGPMHAKLVIVDGSTAVSLGSPLTQNYFNGPTHAVEDPRRGGGNPEHDVSIAIEGPAVAHLHDAFRLHWNAIARSEADKLPSIPEPPKEAAGRDGVAALQVVRTLTEDRFDEPEQGEKGVLEAYLRAIGNSRNLIYLENQYFTNEAIGDALAAVLNDTAGRPDLQVILLANINPNTQPFRDRWERKWIARLRAALPKPVPGQPPEPPRLGVFTRWTYEPIAPRPRIVPVYIHSKVGIVDSSWATVGSANLDGTSLDSNWLGSVLPFGEARGTEVNVLIFNDVDGMAPTQAVDLLRRRLWAEHLGFERSPGHPDPEHPDLAPPPMAGGWLGLWEQRAAARLALLKGLPTDKPPGHILPYPDLDENRTKPREHLNALGISALAFDPIRSVPSFSFEKGEWTSKPIRDWPPDPRDLR